MVYWSPPPPTPVSPNLETKINPSILLIIVILSIIFFISGLLHLIIRLLLRPVTRRDPDDELFNQASVLQGQLQQLFHLHDSGVDQSYIDTLPVFFYKSIIGLKDPFDCAVCLCEFEFDDMLRLLPKCSHAFHMDCIDTWLLSHSTCPLCRSSLLSTDNGAPNRFPPPFVCVLESGSVENSREIGGVGFDREGNSVSGSISQVGFQYEAEFGSGRVGFARKSCDVDEKIVFVKLGKFINVDVGEASNNELNNNNNNNNNNINNNNNNNINNNSNNNVLGSRRCYSMGSFAYVLDETSSLQVPITNNTQLKKKTITKNPRVPLKLGYRATMSEYGCDSQREFNGIETLKTIENRRVIEDQKGYERSKRRESFSVSRIWGRGIGKGNGNDNESSKRTNNSELEIEVSEFGGDNYDETLSCYSVDSLVNPTTSTSSSSTRRTLLWLMGRHNKVVHNHSNSLSSNV
ncbi:hypothetical protein RND81_08G041100 [Saponaria officinalis]|uniref:RING-type E3 ubiquitin transferase n=1 Tax=Saponaria officinalis TaxID=3572 RepID=A0AAW1J582_SAPOF